MQEPREHRPLRLSKSHIAILLVVLGSLLTIVFAIYDINNFLTDLQQGNILAIGLLFSIIALSFTLLQKLGLDFTYKEQIDLVD
jgi:hypothetical protein